MNPEFILELVKVVLPLGILLCVIGALLCKGSSSVKLSLLLFFSAQIGITIYTAIQMIELAHQNKPRLFGIVLLGICLGILTLVRAFRKILRSANLPGRSTQTPDR